MAVEDSVWLRPQAVGRKTRRAGGVVATLAPAEGNAAKVNDYGRQFDESLD
jgi:hypothetical protein